MDDRTRHAREMVDELLSSVVIGGRELAEPVLRGVEEDLAGLWTVPVERQARYLARIEAQLLALIEQERLRFVGATRRSIARAITLALRLAVRVITP